MQPNSLFQLVISCLIALSTAIGAVATWRAADAATTAGNTNAAALAAAVSIEEVRVLANAEHYQNYLSHTSYRRHRELARAMDQELSRQADQRSPAARTRIEELQRRRDEAQAMAEVDRSYFDVRYVNPDDTYDKERDLGATLAEAGRSKQLNAEPLFDEVERYRDRILRFVGTLSLLAAAAWLYTLAHGTRHAFRFVLVFLGTVCLLGGTAAIAAVEWLL